MPGRTPPDGLHLARYRDRTFDAMAVRIKPGEYYVTAARDEMIVTVLGSCVAACIRDPLAGLGGMNHFMLPDEPAAPSGPISAALRYGSFAMERLINEILARGGLRKRLEVKLFGGASVMDGLSPIGERNVAFVETYLRAEGLTIAARHLHGFCARRVHYFPATGRVMMLELPRSDAASRREEARLAARLREEPAGGSVELF